MRLCALGQPGQPLRHRPHSPLPMHRDSDPQENVCPQTTSSRAWQRFECSLLLYTLQPRPPAGAPPETRTSHHISVSFGDPTVGWPGSQARLPVGQALTPMTAS